ncbi:MAG: trypsin-like peptidase domain-containing protein [bacterium]|nr:trypsin-like peptidase domain-containing protein [bacterium]
MRKTFALTILGIFLAFSAPWYAAAHDSAKMKEIFEQSPYVVKLWSFGPSGGGHGTAIIISFSGIRYYLTNAHVVKGTLRAWISLDGASNAPMEEVKVVGRDPNVDLALIAEGSITKNLPAATIGDSDDLRIGEEVYALGYPFGSRAVTVGNITALEVPPAPLFILSQAPLNPGSSGGPLFNARHEIVAMNTAIVTGANLVGLSIPINLVKRILPRLTSEKLVKHGQLQDINFMDSNALVPFFFEELGLTYPPSQSGPIIVVIGPSAASNGFLVGDIITKANNVAIFSAKTLHLELFFEHKQEEEITLTVLRGSKTLDLKAKLVEIGSQSQKKE